MLDRILTAMAAAPPWASSILTIPTSWAGGPAGPQPTILAASWDSRGCPTRSTSLPAPCSGCGATRSGVSSRSILAGTIIRPAKPLAPAPCSTRLSGFLALSPAWLGAKQRSRTCAGSRGNVTARWR